METPPSRRSQSSSSSAAPAETLPPVMLPSSLAEERRTELEAEMVAVQDKILKATKMLPSNLTWNGKPDTLSSFVERFEEWVDIRMGAEAALVLAGKQQDENGDATMASCLYTT